LDTASQTSCDANMGTQFTIVLAVFGALPLLYVGAYLANVQRSMMWNAAGRGPWNIPAEYRIGGETAAFLFRPIHSIDRKLRPQVWQLSGECTLVNGDFPGN
jgi:hypothetical protein